MYVCKICLLYPIIFRSCSRRIIMTDKLVLINESYYLRSDFLFLHFHSTLLISSSSSLFSFSLKLVINTKFNMKFFSVMLIICCYILSQTTVDARATGLNKSYWPLSITGDYQGDLLHQKFESRRQAGRFQFLHVFDFSSLLTSRLGETS